MDFVLHTLFEGFTLHLLAKFDRAIFIYHLKI